MVTASSQIEIRKPVSEVFAYYADPTHLPAFLGDVLAVEPLDADRARWTVAVPFGLRIHWVTRRTRVEQNAALDFQTSTMGLTTRWQLRFAAQGADASTVAETMVLPGGRPGAVVLAMAGKHPQQEVESNLLRLKQVLETGRATSNRNVMGKRFG